MTKLCLQLLYSSSKYVNTFSKCQQFVLNNSLLNIRSSHSCFSVVSCAQVQQLKQGDRLKHGSFLFIFDCVDHIVRLAPRQSSMDLFALVNLRFNSTALSIPSLLSYALFAYAYLHDTILLRSCYGRFNCESALVLASSPYPLALAPSLTVRSF